MWYDRSCLYTQRKEQVSMKRFRKRLTAFLLAITLLLPAFAAAEETPQYPPYPDELKITIAYEEWTGADGQVWEVGVPVTCREEIDRQLRSAQTELFEKAQQNALETDDIEMMATYRVSGETWAGFLLTGRVVREIDVPGGNNYDETVFLDHRVFSFDMSTGEALTLGDVFPAESAAWGKIAQETEKQLRAFWADLPHDEEAITRLCSTECLMQLPFLPCAGRLLIHAPLWDVVEGKLQLTNISLYYPDYRPMMTEKALAQTDNSHRPIVAVTYDDGPSLYYTPQIREHLATYGASATFFIVTSKMLGLADGVRSAMDYGHTAASHTYKHVYEYQVGPSSLREDRQKCLDTHRELLGIEPFLFRAPGGSCKKYVGSEIGWPIILWSYSAGDTGNNTADQLAQRIITGSEDGDILLMHDIKKKTAIGTETFLREMTEMGFMFATVEELLYLHGMTIEPNMVYHDAYTPPMTKGLV